MAVTGDALAIEKGNESVIARNAYIGASGIVDALIAGADIIVTGRVADPSLVVGPAVHELNIGWQNWDALANATLAGHLIECKSNYSHLVQHVTEQHCYAVFSPRSPHRSPDICCLKLVL